MGYRSTAFVKKLPIIKSLVEKMQKLQHADLEHNEQIRALEHKLLQADKKIELQNKRIQNLEQCVGRQIRLQNKKIDYYYYKVLDEEEYEKELVTWYQKALKKPLDLNHTRTYNEKIQWLKLYDRNPLKTTLSDKFLVRDWVKEKIGEKYLIPLLGVWDNFYQIDFDVLPDRFVLKANHGCAWNHIVLHKSDFDWEKARDDYNEWLSTNFAYKNGFELQYQSIQPKIIAEEYIANEDNNLFDYKFWCFDGKVKAIMFLTDRNLNGGLKMSFYDTDWNLLPYSYSYPRNDVPVERPSNLDEMIHLSETLSDGFPHVRVDFYRLNDGSIKFGEMTFTSASGLCHWAEEEFDRVFGEWLKLPARN